MTPVALDGTIACMFRATKHGILKIAAAAFMAALVHPMQAQSKTEKDAVILRYKNKFLLVKKAGVSVGLLSEGLMRSQPGHGTVNIVNDAEDIQLLDEFHCGTEPIHKGEALQILAVRLTKTGYFFDVQCLSPHSITRGVGAFAHPSMERGKAHIAVRAGNNGKDFAAADALAAQWFTLLDGTNPADSAQLGNTATGIFVNQVKLGMSFVEVESALGVPQTRVDLGEKVLYKYKDMTVEFHQGKVTDVR
jgi:hypothetical protein